MDNDKPVISYHNRVSGLTFWYALSNPDLKLFLFLGDNHSHNISRKRCDFARELISKTELNSPAYHEYNFIVGECKKVSR